MRFECSTLRLSVRCLTNCTSMLHSFFFVHSYSSGKWSTMVYLLFLCTQFCDLGPVHPTLAEVSPRTLIQNVQGLCSYSLFDKFFLEWKMDISTQRSKLTYKNLNWTAMDKPWLQLESNWLSLQVTLLYFHSDLAAMDIVISHLSLMLIFVNQYLM